MALSIKKRDPVTGYFYQQRADKGFDFFSNTGGKINIDQYVNATGANRRNLVGSLAQAGDRVSQQAIQARPQAQVVAPQRRQKNIFELGGDYAAGVGNVLKGIIDTGANTAGFLGDMGATAIAGLQGRQDLVKAGQEQSKERFPKTYPGVLAEGALTIGNTLGTALADRDLRQAGVSPEIIRNAVIEQNEQSKKVTGLTSRSDPRNSNLENALGIAGSFLDVGTLPLAGSLASRAAKSPVRLVQENNLYKATDNTNTVSFPTRELNSVEGAPDKAQVDIYKQQMRQDKKLDPLIVKRNSQGGLDIEDGKHRYQAAVELGIENVPVRMLVGNGRTAGQSGSVGLGRSRKVAFKEAAQAGKAERQRADEFAKSTMRKRDQAADFISNNFTDDTAYFQNLDRQVAKNRGEKVRNLPASESLDASIQAYRNAPSIQEQRYNELGIRDFAKKLSNQRDYDTYRIYRTFRTAEERAAQNTKRGESLEEAYSRFTGGRDYNADRQTTINLDANGDKFKNLFDEEVGINRAILRDRANNPDLTLTPEQAESIIQQNPNYTPLTREINEDIQQFTRSGRIGSQQGANVKKLKEGSTTRPIEDPLTALMANADELVKKGQANKVSNIIVKNFGQKLRPLVTEADLIRKENAVISMAELGRDAKEITSAIRNNRNLAGQLSKEIRLAEQATGNAKVTLKQDPSQVTLKLANMSDNQFQRLSNNLRRQTAEYDNLLNQIDILRKRADDIKSDKLGIIRSGDLNAFETNANKNVLRRVVNGREEVYEITDARLAQNLANLGGRELSQAAKVLGVPTRVFKFFTTGPGNVIGFAPIALTRDVLGTILFAKAPIRSIVDPRSWVDAFAIAAKKGELWEGIQKRGIAGTQIEGDRAVRNATSDSLRNAGAKRVKVYLKSPGQIGRDLEDFEMATERFSRGRVASAEYRRAFKRYSNDPRYTPEQAEDMALWDAAREYREGMLNFGRNSKVTRELNAVSAYLNPAVQAGNKVRRIIRENPWGTLVRGSIATSLIAGAYAYTVSAAESKALYEELSDEDKRNNIILIPPGATRDAQTGQIKGIVKIPLPQEYAVLSDAVRGMFEGAEGRDYGDIALSGLAALTGLSTQSGNELMGQLLPTASKPWIENATNYSFFTGEALTPEYVKQQANGDKTQEVRNSTSGTAKFLSRASNGAFSPIEAENVIRSFSGGATKDLLATTDAALGATGAIDESEVTSSNPVDRLQKRYTEAYGKSDAVKFFDKLEGIAQSITNQDDRAAFNLLHEKNSTPGILDSAEKAQIYLTRPDVVKKERELNKWNQSQGKPSNPLFELNDNEIQKVLTYRSAKMLNAGKQTYDKNGNSLFTSLGLDESWYDTFRTKESDFYSKVSKKTDDVDKDPTTFSGAKKPTASPELQSKLDAYYKLPSGTGARSAFLRANPDVLEYWETSDGFTNAERRAIGLKELTDEDEKKSGSFAKKGFGSGGKNDPTLDAYKYAVSLNAGGKAPTAEKASVKLAKLGKVSVNNKARGKAKVSITKSKV